MPSIDRRTFLQGATFSALTALLPISASYADDAKTTFMKDAINDIMASSWWGWWSTVCIPVPFADFDYFYTSGVISWHPNPGQDLPKVTVPHGFCCDLASIPEFFWSFGLPKTGRYAYAAIVHDYLYWDQAIATREQADEILYTAMLDSGVPTITREAINFGVSKAPYFAQTAWEKNTAAKRAGAKRMLKVFPPADKIISWDDWSKDPSHFSD
jgi:hypothetical protein